MSAHFLAFDLGAESGRAIVGRLRADVLDIREIHRFPTSRCGRTGRCSGTSCGSGSRCAGRSSGLDVTGIDSLGVDTWGCDFALLGEDGTLVQNPYHYRDVRTDGVMDAVFKRIPADEIYAITGIQFLPFNTLYQLYAACQATPKLIDAASTMLTVPDLLNYWLTGTLVAEYTNATTTQFVDARTRDLGDADCSRSSDIPTRLLPPVVEAGTVLGRLRRDVCADAGRTRRSWRPRATTPDRRSRRSPAGRTARS